MNHSAKIIIIVLAVGALSTGAYFAIGNKAEGQTQPLLQSEVTNKAVGVPSGNPTTDQTIQSVLRQISDLDQIKLNTDIFEKPEFLALKDISQDLPDPTDVGRPNPFAPIGIDVGVIASDPALGGSPTVSGTTNGSGNGVNGFGDATTGAPVSPAKTKEVQNVGQKSATVSGETTIAGPTNRWFEWGTNQNVVNKTAKQSGTEPTFTATLTGLSAKTTYYVRAAVEQGSAVVYGEIILFKTAE